MSVWVDLNRQPLPDDSHAEEITDYDLASIVAITEEVLFSLTPEPKNRLRMHHKAARKPFYMSQEESDKAKDVLKDDLA